MSTYIRVNGNDYPVSAHGTQQTRSWEGRDSILALVDPAYVEAITQIAAGAPWAIVAKDTVPVIDPDTGEQTGAEEQEEVFDKSEFTVCAGIGVMMGKPTQQEQLQAVLTILDDDQALTVADLYPTFEALTGKISTVPQGTRFRYADRLYKTLQPSHTFAGIFAPGPGTESLFAEITLPGAGEDPAAPIAYEGNMELEEGRFYTQDGATYRCTRSTGAPVYHRLADLVGLYVEVSA